MQGEKQKQSHVQLPTLIKMVMTILKMSDMSSV